MFTMSVLWENGRCGAANISDIKCGLLSENTKWMLGANCMYERSSPSVRYHCYGLPHTHNTLRLSGLIVGFHIDAGERKKPNVKKNLLHTQTSVY